MILKTLFGTETGKLIIIYHCKNWSRAEKVTEAIKERPIFQIMVVFLGKVLGGNYQLNGHKFISFTLKP